MSEKTVINGTLSLVDEATGNNVFAYALQDIQEALTGLQTYSKDVIPIDASATDVAVNLGGVVIPKFIMIYIKSGDGPITIKHDSNTNAITIDKSLILFGKITTITISNPDAIAKSVEVFVAG